MLDKAILDRYRFDAEGLAEEFSKNYFSSHERQFPINPFQVLSDLNVPFVFRNLDKLEGAFFPEGEDGIPLIAFNAKRPIQRIRFTAAHELCHYLKDSDNDHIPWCFSNSKNRIEIYADRFASAFLVPADKLREKLTEYYHGQAISYDNILRIAEFFGVSFEACLYRIGALYEFVLPLNYRDSNKRKYHPAKRRKELGFSDISLLQSLIDSWTDMWVGISMNNATYAYKSDFIFNDSRLEEVDSEKGQVADMITDLRLNGSESEFYHTTESPISDIAGHSDVYDLVFSDEQQNNPISVYDTFGINRILFSHSKFPDYGGRARNSNSMVLGAKFETVDYHEIMTCLQELEISVKELDRGYKEMSHGEIIHRIACIHHRLTQIHPFSDGNGRTSRAFMNKQLTKYGLCPIYIKVEDKNQYFAALNSADKTGDVSELEAIFISNIYRTHAEIYTSSWKEKKRRQKQ